MRLATYNVENFFTRAKAFDAAKSGTGKAQIEAYTALNEIFQKDAYDAADKATILKLLGTLGLDKKDENANAILRENRGTLLKRSMVAGTQVVANGRGDWIGWVELKTAVVDEQATRNTAQVVRDVRADVIAICEAEGRKALQQFSSVLLPQVGGTPYEHVMAIEGNDQRGINVGIMARADYPVVWMRSHVDDRAGSGNLIFSRDCAEYLIWTPSGERLWVLVNHFKSKGYGTQAASDERRLAQAARVREIYERLKSEGETLIAVAGDFNDHPGSAPLKPLLEETDLKDVTASPHMHKDNHTGTYRNGTANEKIDYILLSPAAFARMSAGGIWRKGVWGGKNGALWEIYPEMKSEEQAASDHAAVWCDLDMGEVKVAA